jgi:sulfate/thiosulfate transport system ATP-binding protein
LPLSVATDQTGSMAITADRLSKAFGSSAVLTDVSLDIRAGELLALLGPSGSGKTTLLRIIAGLEIPDAGRVMFGATDTTDVPVQKRQVGFVFQHYALFRHMTVADNIAYGLRARPRRDRPSETAIAKRVGELLDLIKLSAFANRYPAHLSGGQRQRVALARALAVEPRVLLLDEPFGALDAQVRKDLRRWLREIHERTGQTTIFVTHDQDEAMQLADRVAILHNGRLEQLASPAEVQSAPASLAVLRFLGDSTEFEAVAKNGRLHVDGLPTSIPSSGTGPVRLFVRPWHFVRSAPGHGHVSGTIRNLYVSNGRLNFTLDALGRSIVVESPEDPTLRVGDALSLVIAAGHVFDHIDTSHALRTSQTAEL